MVPASGKSRQTSGGAQKVGRGAAQAAACLHSLMSVELPSYVGGGVLVLVWSPHEACLCVAYFF